MDVGKLKQLYRLFCGERVAPNRHLAAYEERLPLVIGTACPGGIQTET